MSRLLRKITVIRASLDRNSAAKVAKTLVLSSVTVNHRVPLAELDSARQHVTSVDDFVYYCDRIYRTVFE